MQAIIPYSYLLPEPSLQILLISWGFVALIASRKGCDRGACEGVMRSGCMEIRGKAGDPIYVYYLSACGSACARACRSSSCRVGPLRARSASGRHSTAVLKFSMPIAFAMPLREQQCLPCKPAQQCRNHQILLTNQDPGSAEVICTCVPFHHLVAAQCREI